MTHLTSFSVRFFDYVVGQKTKILVWLYNRIERALGGDLVFSLRVGQFNAAFQEAKALWDAELGSAIVADILDSRHSAGRKPELRDVVEHRDIRE